MKCLLMTTVIVSLAIATAAPAKPNFSGTWRLNKAKSNYGPVSAPNRMERKILHEDPMLKMTIVQANDEGERTLEQVYRTDGSESVNKVGSREVTSTAKWDGEVLVISSELATLRKVNVGHFRRMGKC